MPAVHEVFTPMGIAGPAFVPRPAGTALARALRTPGMQVLLHGPSGVGKTTLAVRMVASVGLPTVLTDCRRAQSLTEAYRDAVPPEAAALPEVDIASERSAGAATGIASTGFVPRRVTGAADLSAHLLSTGHVWLVEDVHKLPAPARADLVEVMTLCAAAATSARVVALGTGERLTTDDERLPTRLLLRLPLLPPSEDELDAVLVAGVRALGVEMAPELRRRLVEHADGHPSVLHAVALRACVEAGIDAGATVVGVGAVEAALTSTPRTLL